MKTSTTNFFICTLIALLTLTTLSYAQKPTPNFTASPVIGCAPLKVYFTDASSTDAIDWEWDFNNDGVIDVSGDPLPYYTYTTPGTYSVKLTVYNFFDSSSVTKVKFITVTAPISISVSPASACLNDSVQLKATVTGGLKPYTYFWSCSTYPNLSNASSPTIFVDTTTTWTLDIEDSLQCTGTTTFTLNALASPNKPSIIHSLNTLSSSTSESHYQWLWNGSAIGGATAKSYVVDTTTMKSGYIQLRVTNTTGCSALSDSIPLSTLTDVAMEDANPGWMVYPNPNSGKVYISYPFSSTSVVSAEVFSALGTRVGQMQVDERGGRLILLLEDTEPGVYIVQVHTTNSVHSFRILKN